MIEQKFQMPWADRHGFPPALLALGWVLGAFVLFQLAGAFFAIAVFLLDPNVPLSPDLLTQLDQYLGHVFVANSVSQVLVLGLGTWMLALLSTNRAERPRFFRMEIHPETTKFSILTVFLVFAIQPIIWMLSWINAQLPVPESYLAFEEQQLKMIETYLRSDHVVLFSIINIALVPAICEEVMFRGYVMRMFEKNWGVWAAILVSGFIFGAYHLRVTQLLPLVFMGIILAWLTIVSGSLVPAIVAHFVNNAGSVLAATYFPELVFDEMGQSYLPPFLIAALSVTITFGLLYYMNQMIPESRTTEEKGASDV